MPEYRRFIAYFYEYIDGKKQKNAGFAKVELRNGMWRILFRLNTETEPLRPVQAYGFVRVRGWQLGLYMGSMRPGMVRMEEWAYRADVPVWQEKYGFASLAGIWIQSEDGRRYVTVWDDEPIFADCFVLALPEEAVNMEEKGEELERITGREKESAYEKPEKEEGAVGEDRSERCIQAERDSGDSVRKESLDEHAQPEKDHAEPVKNFEKAGSDRQTYATGEMQAAEVSEPWKEGEKKDSNADDDLREVVSDEVAGSLGNPLKDACEEMKSASDKVRSTNQIVEPAADSITNTNGLDGSGIASSARAEAAAEACEVLEKEAPVQPESHSCRSSEQEQALAMLFANRPALEPFSDSEFRECVQLRPCDLVRLQQANCRVGRNTFLQHGFYQYHHLLLARDQEGRCILGVPGVVNAQERYMAGMFAFDRFKPANGYDRGRQFGYWCREI